jgi:hypothetical protein
VCSAEDVEKTRQKAAEQTNVSRKSRKGPEGAPLQISATTGSIIMNASAGGELREDGGGLDEAARAPSSKKSKKERREKREKRRERDSGRETTEQAPRPSKGSKKSSSSKRRPKVGT